VPAFLRLEDRYGFMRCCSVEEAPPVRRSRSWPISSAGRRGRRQDWV